MSNRVVFIIICCLGFIFGIIWGNSLKIPIDTSEAIIVCSNTGHTLKNISDDSFTCSDNKVYDKK